MLSYNARGLHTHDGFSLANITMPLCLNARKASTQQKQSLYLDIGAADFCENQASTSFPLRLLMFSPGMHSIAFCCKIIFDYGHHCALLRAAREYTTEMTPKPTLPAPFRR